jgi:mannosyltransferase OCH1-like enzyme
MQTWIDKNPTWEYILYTEENMPKFINQKQYNEINELC